MTGIDPIPNRGQLETYLVSTFSKIQDQYGQKLDISPAVPTLVQVLTGHVDAVKKYDFIGEAACQFGIRCILARVYSQMNDRLLEALAKKYRSTSQLNKLVVKEIELKKQALVTVNLNTVPLISGVLFSFFGTTAVEKFIENAVLHIAAIELGEATAKFEKQEEGSLAKLNTLISREGGTVEYTPQPSVLEGSLVQWQITLTARLCSTSQLFSHKRVESSMRKAKNAAAKDVLQYFEKHPEEFEKFKASGTTSNVIHPLPILQSEYSIIESNPATPSPTASKKKTPITVKTENPYDDSDQFHVTYTTDEDAIRKLSALLLNNSVDEDMGDGESPTKKRMRDNDQKQTGLNGMMFSKTEAATPTMMDGSDEPTIKAEVDYEKVRQQLLSSNSPTTNQTNEMMDSQLTTEESIDNTTAPPTAATTATATTTATTTASENITDIPAPTNPYDRPTPEINPRILHYFRTLFRNNRGTMSHALSLPGQSKSIFLSIVIQHGDKVKCDSEVKQVGPPHAPVFSASVRLQSKEYHNVFIITEATAARKKDAECHAYHQLTTFFR